MSMLIFLIIRDTWELPLKYLRLDDREAVVIERILYSLGLLRNMGGIILSITYYMKVCQIEKL